MNLSVDLVPFTIQRFTLHIADFGNVTRQVTFQPDRNFAGLTRISGHEGSIDGLEALVDGATGCIDGGALLALGHAGIEADHQLARHELLAGRSAVRPCDGLVAAGR